MSIVFEIRMNMASGSVRKRAPNRLEMNFLKALAGGERRPRGCGSASYFCLQHGWAEPLLVDSNGTAAPAREVAMAERFDKGKLKWKSAGYILTRKGHAIVQKGLPNRSKRPSSS